MRRSDLPSAKPSASRHPPSRLLCGGIVQLPFAQDPAAQGQPSGVPAGITTLRQQSILLSQGRILWRGSEDAAPKIICDLLTNGHLSEQPEIHNLEGRLVTPGLVDCHTHLAFGGHRADEWQRRLAGESYAKILAGGGGIRSTMGATRALSCEDLAKLTQKRLEHWLSQGVTTVEIKSGYGLGQAEELKILEAIGIAASTFPGDVHATLLAAHALPPEYDEDRQGYVRLVCQTLIPEVAAKGLADAVDVFCESIAFSLDETQLLLEAAKKSGLNFKLHAEQLSASGAAALGGRMAALSCDHLEYLDAEGADALAKGQTVAVLLPGAFFTMRESKKPPVQLLRDRGVAMAVATDFNPGTSPIASLLTAAHLACVTFGLTIDEAYAGITTCAARALRKEQSYGALMAGDPAHLAIWNATGIAELIQYIGQPFCHGVYANGHWRGDERNSNESTAV
jgi:imidazolonepropionase